MSERPRVLYSTSMPLHGGGMGTIAGHACDGLRRGGFPLKIAAGDVRRAAGLAPLARCPPWVFRKALGLARRLQRNTAADVLFDRWAASFIAPGDWYFGWLHLSLASIRRCHRWGGRTFVDRGSVEPRLQDRWLRGEYEKHGLRSAPIPPFSVRRMVREADETDYVVVTSRLVADSYLEAGYPAKKILLNPLGVSRPQDVPAPSAAQRPFRFVFAGQLSVQKGLPWLLETWAKLAPPSAELLLLGVIPPTERHFIEPLVRSAKGVAWNGPSSDVCSVFGGCDALLLPSAQDGFGLVVLEAMACGLPVVVSDRVGAKDCVDEGRNGFIVPYGNAEALSERLRWFVADPQRAANLRPAALDTARRFSWAAYGDRMAELVRKG